MKNNDKPQDADLAAFLEGKMPVSAARKLRQQLARESQRLKQETRDHLERNGNGMPGIETAPASLRQKLRAIPDERTSMFRIALPLGLAASVIVLLIALLLVNHQPSPDDTPSQTEIEQARAELVVAFGYLRQISNRSGVYMKREIGRTLRDALNDRIFRGVTSDTKGG